MITGFEEQTQDLTADELKIAHLMVRAFIHRGEDVGITSVEIMRSMRAKGYKMNGARLRKIIRAIRTRNMLNWVIANGQEGYIYTKDVKKVLKYIQSLEDRENAIRGTRMSFNLINLYV